METPGPVLDKHWDFSFIAGFVLLCVPMYETVLLKIINALQQRHSLLLLLCTLNTTYEQ